MEDLMSGSGLDPATQREKEVKRKNMLKEIRDK
jgi:hypothetical protein